MRYSSWDTSTRSTRRPPCWPSMRACAECSDDWHPRPDADGNSALAQVVAGVSQSDVVPGAELEPAQTRIALCRCCVLCEGAGAASPLRCGGDRRLAPAGGASVPGPSVLNGCRWWCGDPPCV